ncbi:MAG: (Na+)-NQR maturation NqrM [Pontibacterium sp.]
MEVLILTFVILGLVIIGMSVGVILSNKPIKGSCGGMASLGMDTVCDICGGDPNKCDEEDGSSNAPKKGVELGKEL